MEETQVKQKKILLEVFAESHEKTGRPIINWGYGEKINAYFLIGVLEDIKLELLGHIDHESIEAPEND